MDHRTITCRTKARASQYYVVHPDAVMRLERYGRDGRYFDCRTTRPLRRETPEIDIIETVISDIVQPAMTKSTLV
jgi:hypothetical protein